MTSDARNSQIPSFPFASPVSGRSSTVYGMFTNNLPRSCFFRFELRTEILRGARHAVLVRAEIHDRLGQEVAVARRRRRRPLERRRLPRIAVDGLAPLDAHEKVDDEKELKQPEGP